MPASLPAISAEAIDPDADRVIARLTRSGFLAYLVGGCVRDLLLGVAPKDFDIATSARPRQVKRLFRNSRIIGRRFKLVHVVFGTRTIEVATFRAPPEQEGDDPYITRDNIFGTEVSDALRRDFTINGLFYDIEGKRVIDHVGGLADLAARRVRTIGEAELRIREDPVRILRAAKFAGRLSLELDPALRAACVAHAGDLAKAAPPRVLEELFRLLSGTGGASSFRILEELGGLSVLLPELCPLPASSYAALERLSMESRGERGYLPQSLLLSVLLAPLVARALPLKETHDYEHEVQEILHPVLTRITAARRDATRVRQCLAAQVRLLEEPVPRSARRLCARDFYPEARHLREILGPLVPLEDDPIPLWDELGSRVTPGAEAPPEGRRRRRRRRGGRRGGQRRGAPPARGGA